jgi:tetratricopeptide (TPR) repeat protein
MLAIRLGEYGMTSVKLLSELQNAPTPVELETFQQVAAVTIPRSEGVFTTIEGTLADLPSDVRKQLSPLGYVADIPISNALLSTLTSLAEGEISRLVAECSRRSVFSIVDGKVVVHALTVAAIASTNAKGLLAAIFRLAKRVPAIPLRRAHARLDVILTASPVTLREELAHHEHIFIRCRNILGEDNVSVLAFANSLAVSYDSAGRYEEAIRLHEQTLTIREQVLGPEHPDTAKSIWWRGTLLAKSGDYEGARIKLQRALTIFSSTLGKKHPTTQQCQRILASLGKETNT